jgi:hypothetical protein
LAQFPAKLGRRGLANAARAGAAVLRTKAREKAQAIGLRDEGNLVKGIRIKKLKTRDWRTTAVFGAYHGGKGWYGALYERGFKKPSGKRTQRPHLRPSLDENVQEITDAIRKRLAEEIQKMMPHLVRRF